MMKDNYAHYTIVSLITLLLLANPTINWATGISAYDEVRRDLAQARRQLIMEAPVATTLAPKESTSLDVIEERDGEKLFNLHSAILDVADANGLPPAMLATFIAIESNGDPCARSRAGAQGLAQIMPATAARYGLQDAYEPYPNLDCGARILKELLDKNQGRLLTAAAAYNAGEGVLNRPWDNWPRETKSYVGKIHQHYVKYAKDRWKTMLPKFIVKTDYKSCRQ